MRLSNRASYSISWHGRNAIGMCREAAHDCYATIPGAREACDRLRRHHGEISQIIPDLPPGLIAAAWYYTSEDPTYKRWLAPLIANHVPHIVESGVMSYDNIAPDFNTNLKYRHLPGCGPALPARSAVNTVWADDGQLLFRSHSLRWPMAQRGMATRSRTAPIFSLTTHT